MKNEKKKKNQKKKKNKAKLCDHLTNKKILKKKKICAFLYYIRELNLKYIYIRFYKHDNDNNDDLKLKKN